VIDIDWTNVKLLTPGGKSRSEVLQVITCREYAARGRCRLSIHAVKPKIRPINSFSTRTSPSLNHRTCPLRILWIVS